MDVEEATVRAFITPRRRAHYVALLATPKKRKKLLNSFYHLGDLDSRFAHPVPNRESYPAEVYELLRQRGAPERCYVMSTFTELDGREMDLRTVVEEIIGRGNGTLISCVPGRLGYFEGEDPGERYILERPASERIT